MTVESPKKPRTRSKVGRPPKKLTREDELLIPSKYPPPAWMTDPSLLPKRPPGR